MLSLYEVGKPPNDVVLVCGELERAGDLDAAGGAAYISTLGIETPTAVHVVQYAQVVQRKSQLRRIAEAGGAIREAALGGAGEDELSYRYSNLQAALSALARPSAVASAPFRTLADISDAPPGKLLFGMLEPDGPTLLYGAPGVGKGMTGSHIVIEAQQAGMLPCVYDAERRPREWARRVSGLGGDRSRVVYIEPTDLPREMRGRPLWECTPALGAMMKASGGDLLLIDSALTAVGLGEERLRTDAQVPFLFVGALDQLGHPSATFGHPPKGQPEGDPFGSFAWVAANRLTWLGTRAEGEGHVIRWRPRKRNERGHIPGILLTFEYGDDGRPCSVQRDDDDEATRDWILAAVALGPRTVADMAEEMFSESEETGEDALKRIQDRLRKACYRMAREGWLDKNGKTGPRVTWGLNVTGGPK